MLIKLLVFNNVRYLGLLHFKWSVSEFNKFELWLKSAKNRFQWSDGLNLEKLHTILSGTNFIWAVA